jgi:hypothetical protein
VYIEGAFKRKHEHLKTIKISGERKVLVKD